MYWILIIVAALAGAFVGQYFRISWFRSHASVGQSCVFYVGCDRYQGEIISADADSVVIANAFGTYARVRAEIYPA